MTGVLALGLVVWNPDALRRLELISVDARHRLDVRGSPPPELIVVRADDAILPPDGFLRGEYARLVEAADRAGARAIAVDIAFDSEGTDGAETRALAGTLESAQRPLVIGFTEFVSEGGGFVPALTLGEDFTQDFCVGDHCAYLGLPDDPDGRIRRLEFSVPTTSSSPKDGRPVELRSFAVAAARAADPAFDEDGLPRSPRLAWEDQTEETTWIDFPGGPGTIPSVAAADVLRGETGALSGKLVVIGDATRGVDEHETPYGDVMEGPELQAAAIGTLLDGAPLQSAPAALDVLLLVLCAVAGPACVLLLGWRRRAAAVTLVATGLLLAAAVLSFAAGLVIGVVLPLAALLTGAAASAAVALARAHRTSGLAGSKEEG